MNCPRCGLPEELCVCDEMTKEGQRIRVRSDKRRYGKVVTIIDGFKDVDVDKIARDLKKRLACGGTSKNDKIELQGDHTHKMKDILIEMGFSGNMIDVA
ncbi:MAG: stress response translation initiation inhibitor YciH [Candidatus Altiarchaeales archaeon ex4484_43]|nr:MAG: stress response translation initiation inhibitor YciH [Candidatus Altiarchaeales archaeon ex4484_43]